MYSGCQTYFLGWRYGCLNSLAEVCKVGWIRVLPYFRHEIKKITFAFIFEIIVKLQSLVIIIYISCDMSGFVQQGKEPSSNRGQSSNRSWLRINSTVLSRFLAISILFWVVASCLPVMVPVFKDNDATFRLEEEGAWKVGFADLVWKFSSLQNKSFIAICMVGLFSIC